MMISSLLAIRLQTLYNHHNLRRKFATSIGQPIYYIKCERFTESGFFIFSAASVTLECVGHAV